jgi:hypothetical protein
LRNGLPRRIIMLLAMTAEASHDPGNRNDSRSFSRPWKSQ